MSDVSTTKGNVCPHCGKPVRLRWVSFLPSNNRNRAFRCSSCGGTYDLSDGSKVASILGGLVALGPAVLLFGRLTRGQGGSRTSVVVGTLAIVVIFAVASILAGRLALGLVRKP